MAHPYSHHREMQVGHRRVKHIMRSGGHAVGGGKHADVKEDKALIKRMLKEHESQEHEGMKRGGRLDKRARGGGIKAKKAGGAVEKKAAGGKVQKFQLGGPVRKMTPSKHKPHLAVNIVNIHRGARPRPPLAGGAAMPAPGAVPPVPAAGGLPMRPPGMQMGGVPGRPAFAGAGLPPQAALAARNALAARPALPVGAMGARPFARGGVALGKMRKGKEYGEGSGSGRLEEFHHMKGRYP